MADKSKDNKNSVLKRGMADYDWYTSDNQPRQAAREPFRWGIPADLRPGAKPRPKGSSRAAWYRRIRLAVAAVVAIACVLFVAQASLRGFDAEGESMEPAVHNGDRIVVNKLAYAQIDFGLLDWAPLIDIHDHWFSPSRGDIIVFKSPVEDKELIKRVIGLPGEEVTIADDRVYIDQKPLDEPYAQGETLCEQVCNWQLGAGEYFVLGDNRENSLDSREGWLVTRDLIDGKKLFSY
jgi:signal peptidase I